ncbi:hypothetical protein KC341_g83 [Hortaea werneckii]|nr:hypothetical protein KC341_g83 [Hortaea werneckii]
MLALTHATVGAPSSPEITVTVPANVLKAYEPPNSCPIENAGSVYGSLSRTELLGSGIVRRVRKHVEVGQQGAVLVRGAHVCDLAKLHVRIFPLVSICRLVELGVEVEGYELQLQGIGVDDIVGQAVIEVDKGSIGKRRMQEGNICESREVSGVRSGSLIGAEGVSRLRCAKDSYQNCSRINQKQSVVGQKVNRTR